MPVLRLAAIIFFTLMLASLSALASAPDTKPDSQQLQGLPPVTSVADGSASGRISEGHRSGTSRPISSTRSQTWNGIVPSTGENIPGAGQ